MKKRFKTSIIENTWIKGFLIVSALLISPHFSRAQDFSAYKKAFFIRGKDTLRYRILYPEHYEPGKSYPLIVYLHGAGFRGNDNEQQLGGNSKYYGAGKDFLNDSVRKKYPALVVFPQCPADSMWFKIPPSAPYDTTAAVNHKMNTLALSTPERMVKLLIDSLAKHKIADRKRIYLGGTSLGAFGTYDLIVHYPDYFAAAFPICGQANVVLYPKKAANVPVWIFHGAADDIINPWPDRSLIKALQQNGAKNAKYTEYPGLKHDIEARVFAEPDLFSWLFSFKK
ncbi:Putative esterase [Mucilaginibacter gossypiicola]|uniref:Putative esterase n=1 Tax=Mucilaginibacter gossypiicola TaxID=551995 RepID=A0A1H8HE33_9SPHI|nr:alpha/beta hydrolase-fold protein [Mucilaginibacter gossypiicola]SEN54259.1 Putative esterase [Mucilaginibacter gossypiicola]